MTFQARLIAAQAALPLRMRFREDCHCQIVHDSLHRREGWTRTYLLEVDGESVGFGSIAIQGPWKDKPTVYEFYLLPAHRHHLFRLFEAFVAASGAQFFEVQTNETELSVALHSYGREFAIEKIVFRDHRITTIPSQGAQLQCLTPSEKILAAIEQRQGGGEWQLILDGQPIAKGGILFHYNRPYGDIYMDVEKPFRNRGFGAYLVQELKRECYEFGAIPCARCNFDNIPSRNTLLKAGFAASATIVLATIPPIHQVPRTMPANGPG
jgi:GNAT superfamily N-acetyltransferase